MPDKRWGTWTPWSLKRQQQKESTMVYFEPGEVQPTSKIRAGVHTAEILSATEKWHEKFGDGGANVIEMTLDLQGGQTMRAIVPTDPPLWRIGNVFMSAGIVPEGECSAELLIGRTVTVEVTHNEAGYARVVKWRPAERLEKPGKARAPKKPKLPPGDDIPF